MSEENKNQEEKDFSNFNADYPGILDVSPSERLSEWLYLYFARIQTDTQPKYLLSIVTSIFMSIQAVFPALIQQAVLKKDESIVASTMKFLSIIWIGGSCFDSTSSYIVSIIASVFVLGFLILICFRAHHYSQIKSMKTFEINIMYAISTYILPIFVSFITGSIGREIFDLATNQVDIAEVVSLIISVITFALLVYTQYNFIYPRIMFIRDAILMWTPGAATLVNITMGLNAAMFSATIMNNQIATTVILAIIFVLSYIIGIYMFLDSMFINKKVGISFCALILSNGSGSILNIAATYVDIDYNIVFFMIIVFIILSIFILHFMHRRFSQISMTRLDQAAQDEYFYGRSDNLARDVRRSLDYCSPGIFMFTIYDQFLDDFTNCVDMLFVYARIVSAFPSYKYKLEVVDEKLKMSSISCRRLLNFQIRFLISHRNTAATSKIVKSFDAIDNVSHVMTMNLKRFWENVLHGNTDAFWTNITTLDTLKKQLNKEINQMVNDYENCPEVVSNALKLHTSMTFEFEEARRLKGDLDLLEKGIPAHKDRALLNMLSLFPAIMSSISDLTKEIDIVGNALNDAETEINEITKREAINDMMKNSKVGKYNFSILYFIIAGFICILFYILYVVMFKVGLVDSIFNTHQFLYDANHLLHTYARYLFTKTIKYAYFQAPDTIFSNSDAQMKNISPFWFERGLVKRINPSEDEVMELSLILRNIMQTMQSDIQHLDESRPGIYEFIDSWNNYKFEGSQDTISESIVNIMMQEEFDEKFVNNSFMIYNKFKNMLNDISETVTFTDAFNENMNYIIITLLVDLLVFAFPMMLTFFRLSTQMEEIAVVFSSIPSPELRKVMGSTTKEDVDNMSTISAVGITKMNFELYFGVFLTVFPPLILTYGFYFYTKSYTYDSKNTLRSGGVLMTPLSDVRMSFIATAIAFLESYPISSKYETNKAEVMRILSMRDDILDQSKSSVSNQMVLSAKQSSNWFDIEDNYRLLYEPLQDTEDHIPVAKANWERLASFKFTMTVDCFIFISKLTMPNQTTSIDNVNYNAYFLWWVYDAVEGSYYDTIKDAAHDVLSSGRIAVPIFICIYIIFIFIAVIFGIYRIQRFSTKIKFAMKMLVFIDLETIMNDSKLMNLITIGRAYDDKATSKEFNYADVAYLRNTKTAFAIINSQLDVINYNTAFDNMFPEITNIKELGNDQMCLQVYHAFESKEAEREFKANIEVTNANGELIYANVKVIAMYDTRPALQNENVQITSCILILQDNSQYIAAAQKIKLHQEFIVDMLKKILPDSILNELMNGSDTISTTVHSVTIGSIEVIANTEMDMQQKFKLYSHLYKHFDEMLLEYSTLSKLKISSNKYSFAGGLFMSINKPEKHAEDSIRFCTEILKSIPQLRKELESDFSVKIGVHTGGPVIAGVMSPEFPTYQIIGSVEEYTEKSLKSSEENKIRVTRSVYELIFSAGFKVAESEPIKVGTETVQSYTIDVR